MRCHLETCGYNEKGWCVKTHVVMVADGRCGHCWSEYIRTSADGNKIYDVIPNQNYRSKQGGPTLDPYAFDAEFAESTDGKVEEVETAEEVVEDSKNSVEN